MPYTLWSNTPSGLDIEEERGTPSWQPVLFQPSDAEDAESLRAILDSGRVGQVCDTITDQLTELILSRRPDRSFSDADLEQAITEQLAGVELHQYGTWVWYPWSARLVHLLPREEFRLVRTDRNRGKIDRKDQRSLARRTIAIAGLSLGNSAALTLALEGVGGVFKLADFDRLGLSNLNRLRAGVHHLGANKTVIAAREMFEIDPYLTIEIYPEGLHEGNLTAFLTGGAGRVDLLVEECDDPYVKVAIRELARTHRIPVLMDTNDRGMLDIERFDLEPDRPLFHGLLGDLRAQELRELGQEQKVAAIVPMLDESRISPELRASLPLIGRTLSSWPQLASGVTLGGALVTEAARRILLDTHRASGRYYVDLAHRLDDAAPAASITAAAAPALTGLFLPCDPSTPSAFTVAEVVTSITS